MDRSAVWNLLHVPSPNRPRTTTVEWACSPNPLTNEVEHFVVASIVAEDRLLCLLPNGPSQTTTELWIAVDVSGSMTPHLGFASDMVHRLLQAWNDDASSRVMSVRGGEWVDVGTDEAALLALKGTFAHGRTVPLHSLHALLHQQLQRKRTTNRTIRLVMITDEWNITAVSSSETLPDGREVFQSLCGLGIHVIAVSVASSPLRGAGGTVDDVAQYPGCCFLDARRVGIEEVSRIVLSSCAVDVTCFLEGFSTDCAEDSDEAAGRAPPTNPYTQRFANIFGVSYIVWKVDETPHATQPVLVLSQRDRVGDDIRIPFSIDWNGIDEGSPLGRRAVLLWRLCCADQLLLEQQRQPQRCRTFADLSLEVRKDLATLLESVDLELSMLNGDEGVGATILSCVETLRCVVQYLPVREVIQRCEEVLPRSSFQNMRETVRVHEGRGSTCIVTLDDLVRAVLKVQPPSSSQSAYSFYRRSFETIRSYYLTVFHTVIHDALKHNSSPLRSSPVFYLTPIAFARTTQFVRVECLGIHDASVWREVESVLGTSIMECATVIATDNIFALAKIHIRCAGGIREGNGSTASKGLSSDRATVCEAIQVEILERQGDVRDRKVMGNGTYWDDLKRTIHEVLDACWSHPGGQWDTFYGEYVTNLGT